MPHIATTHAGGAEPIFSRSGEGGEDEAVASVQEVLLRIRRDLRETITASVSFKLISSVQLNRGYRGLRGCRVLQGKPFFKSTHRRVEARELANAFVIPNTHQNGTKRAAAGG